MSINFFIVNNIMYIMLFSQKTKRSFALRGNFRKGEEMNYDYLHHLLVSLGKQKDIIMSQLGKTDIEPPDYVEKIETWFTNLSKLIYEKPPEYYVKGINIYQNSLCAISYINYKYYVEGDKIQIASLNLFESDDSNFDQEN